MSLKIAFMGTPEFSVPTLDALLKAGHEIVAVYTQPPRPKGRGKKPTPTAIDLFAQDKGLKVYTPQSLSDEDEISIFKDLNLDVAIVVAYGLILPDDILKGPKYGCINVHASLLPRWRGAAPVHRAIMAGDTTTGITIMQMDQGLDTGPILTSIEVAISQDDTTETLHNKLSLLGGECLISTLEVLDKGDLKRSPQEEDGVTYAHKIEKSEARIDWTKSAPQIDLKVRGLSPFPGAWFSIEGERIKVLKGVVLEQSGPPGTTLDDCLTIASGSGSYRVLVAQKAGKAPMEAGDLLRGYPISKGTVLDQTP